MSPPPTAASTPEAGATHSAATSAAAAAPTPPTLPRHATPSICSSGSSSRRCACPLTDYALIAPPPAQDIWARTARAELGYNAANGSAWLTVHLTHGVLIANRSLNMRLATAGNRTVGDPHTGLIWGPPEHDTCHEPDFYYHNQVRTTACGIPFRRV